jgi:hypothetical protein
MPTVRNAWRANGFVIWSTKIRSRCDDQGKQRHTATF